LAQTHYGLTHFATQHPYAAASIVAVTLIIILFAIRVAHALQKLMSDAERFLA
jgi:hypothetical protein